MPTSSKPLSILLLSTADKGGGAERDALNLYQAYRARGHQVRLVVGHKKDPASPAQSLAALAEYRAPWQTFWLKHAQTLSQTLGPRRGVGRAAQALRFIGQPRREWAWWRGREFFAYPAAQKFFAQLSPRPDVIHAHNLHGGYFDLRLLAALSQDYPLFLTLHDMWLLTGHCAYSLSCGRWESGCGACPDLSLYPALQRDGTAANWRAKAAIFKQSRLHLISPSAWLLQLAKRSMLRHGLAAGRIIPYGVDLRAFRPSDSARARAALGLPLGAKIVLFMGSLAGGNMYKDYAGLQAVIQQMASVWTGGPLFFLGLGHTAPPESIGGGVELHFAPFQTDPAQIAAYYQAADLFLHPTRADNLPISILEALACGRPVVASAVGGIPEQIQTLGAVGPEGATGILCPPGDAAAMAGALGTLLGDEPLRQQLGRNAAAQARAHYDLNRQIEQTLAFYGEAMANR
jgi:glycosyltransferase involved in cell wall biosynthesis